MSTDDSVSVWIEALKAGQETAATKLWRHFYSPLVAPARRKPRDLPRRCCYRGSKLFPARESPR